MPLQPTSDGISETTFTELTSVMRELMFTRAQVWEQHRLIQFQRARIAELMAEKGVSDDAAE